MTIECHVTGNLLPRGGGGSPFHRRSLIHNCWNHRECPNPTNDPLQLSDPPAPGIDKENMGVLA
jgi:hypothetical protein